MNRTILYGVTRPYGSALSLIPRALAVNASRTYSKSMVFLRDVNKISFEEEASKQKVAIRISEPVFNSKCTQAIGPLNSKGDFESKEEQREEVVGVSSETERDIDILVKENVLHKEEDITKDYFNDNPDGKPTDTKSFGITGLKPTETKSTTGVEEEQKNDPHKTFEVTTQDIDQEEDFFNDYPDGKRDDPKIQYKQTLRDEYSPYVRRLLFNERETPTTISKIKNISPYDKTEQPPSTAINKTFDDLRKLCLNSSNNLAQKLTGPVNSKNYSMDINSGSVQPSVPDPSKTPKCDKLPETNCQTFSKLAVKFLNPTSKNHLKNVGPVITNIKNSFNNQSYQPDQTNVHYRKISDNINPPTRIIGYGKPRSPESNTKTLVNDIDLNKQFDEIARRCLKSPISKIDQIIIEEMAKPRYGYNPCMKKKGQHFTK